MGSRKPLPPKTEAAVEGGARPGGRCPICTAPTEAKFRPFCSRRCADVDLSRWLRGGYAIAGRADVDEDGDDSTAANQARQGSPSDENED
jgi:uncharacterized protein